MFYKKPFNRPTKRLRSQRYSAFSLVEIMVVLVIIGLLAGVVTINVRGYLVKGKQNTARLEIARIVDALETFYSLHDRYPTNEESLRVLYEGTERMAEGLLDGEAIDPWTRPYQYNAPGRNGPYEVVSFGADGQEGGEGNDADVESWNLKESTPGSAHG